ncbi:GNAT family N-acetyltransferase [Vibrio parahaemolyticus]
MDVIIKEVSSEDWEQVVHIGVQTNEANVIPMLQLEGREAMRSARTSDIRKVLANPRCKVLKAVVNSQIVGYIACGGYYIAQLYVLPEFQGRGIGSKLVSEVKAASEVSSLQLKASLNAVGFYRKLGFEQTAEQQSINSITFVPMELRIGT